MIAFWTGFALGWLSGPLTVYLIAFYFTSRDKSVVVRRHRGTPEGHGAASPPPPDRAA